jgi:hypothetical protein
MKGTKCENLTCSSHRSLLLPCVRPLLLGTGNTLAQRDVRDWEIRFGRDHRTQAIQTRVGAAMIRYFTFALAATLFYSMRRYRYDQAR